MSYKQISKMMLFSLVFGACFLNGVVGFTDCWLESCEKLNNLQNIGAQIISYQGDLANELASIAESVGSANGSVSDAILEIESNIAASESNVLSAISSSEGILTPSLLPPSLR